MVYTMFVVTSQIYRIPINNTNSASKIRAET